MGRKLKKIGALVALVTVAALVGCSGGGSEAKEPTATVTVTATPTPTVNDRLALQELANFNSKCVEDAEMNPVVFDYFGECGDGVYIEFGSGFSHDEHVKTVTDSYRNVADMDPWLISDSWMIKNDSESLDAVKEAYPTAELFEHVIGDPISDATAEPALAAVKRVFGVTCEEFHRDSIFIGYEVKAQRQFDCDGTDPIKIFSSVPGISGTHIYVFESRGDVIGFGESASINHDFDGKDRYGVEGDFLMIAPLSKAKAKEISKLINGTKVVDINLNPFTER